MDNGHLLSTKTCHIVKLGNANLNLGKTSFEAKKKKKKKKKKKDQNTGHPKIYQEI